MDWLWGLDEKIFSPPGSYLIGSEIDGNILSVRIVL